MPEWLLHFSELIAQGIQLILNFLYENTIDLLKSFCLYYLKITEAFTYVQLRVGLDLASDLINQYIVPLGLSEAAFDSWSFLPSEIKSFLCYLKFHEVVSIILSAYALRLVRGMIPFLR